LDSGGYGAVGVLGTSMKAHRVAWMIHHNCSVPEGKDILHSCVASRTCCNPAHLRPGTDLENRRDAMNQGRAKYVNVKGSDHGRSKLTDADVIKIRALSASGVTNKKIGPMFGVTPSMVSYIKNRRNWNHL